MFDKKWVNKQILEFDKHYQMCKVIPDKEDMLNWILDAIEQETGQIELNSIRAKKLLMEWARNK